MKTRSHRTILIFLASAALAWAALACGRPPVLLEYLGTPAARVSSPLEREAGPGAASAPTATFTATLMAGGASVSEPTATRTASPFPSATHTLWPTSTFTPAPSPTFTPTTPAPPPPIATDPPSTAGYSSFVIALINGERTSRGLPALSYDATLMTNAQVWSEYMAVNNIFTHSSAGNENIAAGYATPAEAVAAWMKSDGHRANILNPSYTRIGAGYAYSSGSTYGHYWTAQFLP